METVNPAENERFLVARAREGDEVAWERLVGRYQEALFRLAYLIAGDGDEARDVAQEAFIRAYLKLDQYDDGRPLRPWLLSITANLARNRRRSIGRYWSAIQRYLRDNHEETPAPPAQRGEAEILWQAVRKLPEASRAVVYLRYFLDLSEAETAETLNIARGTVKSRSHRALEKLRRIIESDYPELADERTTV